MTQSSHVPDSWQQVRLGDFALSEKGKKPSNEVSTPEDFLCIPYIDIEAFEKNILKSWTDGKNCRLCFEDDFLMVWDGSRSGYIGKGMFGALGSTLVRINFPKINNRYAYYFLLSKYQEINTRAKGSGTPHVDPDLLWNYSFPIAPLVEQARIVNKIEELFSEIDDGIQSLETAKKQLDIYREVILIQAFEGTITESWRQKEVKNIPTSSELLTTLSSLQDNYYSTLVNEWEKSVIDWENNNKIEKKPTKPKNLAEVTVFNSEELSLPTEWLCLDFKSVAEITGGLTKNQKRHSLPLKMKYLRVANVHANKLQLDEVHEIGVSKQEFDKVILKANDLLIVEGNGSIEHIGRIALWDDSITDCGHQNHLIRARCFGIQPKFALYFFNSYKGRQLIIKEAKSTSGLHTLSLSKVSALKIPYCSIEEQEKIIEFIEDKLNLLEIVSSDIALSLDRLTNLKKLILKKAFSGELIPQDPNDEPASVLLERIKAEKEEELEKAKANKAPKKPTKRKTKATKEDEPAQQELI